MSNDKKRSELYNARIATREAKRAENIFNALRKKEAEPMPTQLDLPDAKAWKLSQEIPSLDQEFAKEIVLPKSAKAAALEAAVGLLAPMVTHAPLPSRANLPPAASTNPSALTQFSGAAVSAPATALPAALVAQSFVETKGTNYSATAVSAAKTSSRTRVQKTKTASAPERKLEDGTTPRTVSVEEFQALVEQRRKETAPGEIVDLSALANLKIQGVETDFGYAGSLPDIREVISGLNVSGTNFPKVFALDGLYFRDSNFSGCLFGNTTDLTLDGCNLNGADMSNTVQTNLFLGDDTGFIGRTISALDHALHSNAQGSEDYQRAQLAITQLKKRQSDLLPTSAKRLKLEGATFFNAMDNPLVDYEGTSFDGVRIVNYNGFCGKNMNLTGATYQPRTPMGEAFKLEFNITAPLSAEEVTKQGGEFVGSMLRANLINPLAGGAGPVTVAIAGTAINGSFADTLLRCDQVFGTGLNHEPVSVEDAKDLAESLNENYARHNVRFIVDDGVQPFDYRLTFCQSPLAVDTGFDAFYALVGKENFISIGSRSIKDPATTIHEAGHAFGAIHPFETGVPAQQCSPLVSIMCYPNALDIMVPLGDNTKVATLRTPIDPGPKDHQMMNLVFGANPAYVPSNRETQVVPGLSRLIAGDENFRNVVKLDTASLPTGVKWEVIDAASAIGTCFEFPCDLAMAATSAEGAVLVLYRDGVDGAAPEIVGSTAVFGGKTNEVYVDGVKIDPIVLTDKATPTRTPATTPVASASPTAQPSQTANASETPLASPSDSPSTSESVSASSSAKPSSVPKDHSTLNTPLNTKLIALFSGLGGFAALVAAGVACHRKRKASGRAEVAPAPVVELVGAEVIAAPGQVVIEV